MDTTKAIEIKMHIVFTPWDDVDELDDTKHMNREALIKSLQRELGDVIREQIPPEFCCTPIFGWRPFTEKDL
jgi:hypothetical protein